MTQWNLKRAGLLYEALSAHANGLPIERRTLPLRDLIQRVGDASSTTGISNQDIALLHSEVCKHCIQERLYPCSGHQHQLECAFLDSLTSSPVSQY